MPAELIGDVGDSRAGRRAENGIGCARWPSGGRDRASALGDVTASGGTAGGAGAR